MTPSNTPLFASHTALGGKMVDFSGWMMPIRYGSVIEEHLHVRSQTGLFDVSHMGEVRVKGKDALAFIQYATINDASKLANGAGQYSATLNEQGGIIDDLIVYRLGDQEFFICVNAANVAKDFNWLKELAKKFDVSVTNESCQWAQVAVQGPTSRQTLLDTLKDPELKKSVEQLSYTHIMEFSFEGSPGYIARTGYTGELGYEIYVAPDKVETLWNNLLKSPVGTPKPIGLAARDSLRLEACYLLYGQDMNAEVTPLEAGIAWATKLDKANFCGKDALLKQKGSIPHKLLAFVMDEPGIARSHMSVFWNDTRVGTVTSAGVLPSLGVNGGMVFVDNIEDLKVGSEIYIDIRDQKKRARIVKKPLYTAKTKD